jgi:hypothetical protein
MSGFTALPLWTSHQAREIILKIYKLIPEDKNTRNNISG